MEVVVVVLVRENRDDEIDELRRVHESVDV